MPAKSKQQWKFMKGISEGTITPRGSLTPAKASEYISGQPSPKNLPRKKEKKGK